MESIWEILKIEATKDTRAIKRAYAALTREYNPEEHPEEFLRIREAYEKALKAAEQGSAGTEEAPKESNADPAYREFQWDFTEENSCEKHPAILKFRELYTGKRRRDRTAWMDYFVSDDFLEVWREEGFTSALLGVVEEQQETFPLNKEFMTEFYLAYGIRCQNQQFFLENNAAFQGIDHLMEIVQKGPFITRLKGNDSAIAAGFRDYRTLLFLASANDWNDQNLLALGKLIDGYMLGNISDRPIKDEYQYELYQRHPKSLRLINYFFAHTELPESAYRLLWNHLHLDTATAGKNKLFYGGLRDTVIAHVPEILDKPRVNYMKLNKEYGNYVYRSLRPESPDWTPEKEAALREEMGAFFAREEVQYALMDERYVDEQVLHYWIPKSACPYFVERLEEHFRTHANAPYRDRVLEVISEWNVQRQIDREYFEDENSIPEFGVLDFHQRPYVRYYLNTAFHMAYGVRSSESLSSFLLQRFLLSPKWAAKFTDPDQGGFSPDRPLEISFGENVIRIILHQKYWEYRWNSAPVGPKFPWENLKEIPDEMAFWLLLPITAASFDEYPEVCEEVTRRLLSLPLHQEDIPVIADCICGKLCQFKEDMENQLPIATLYQETEERLYGCDIFGNGVLILYEETPNGIYDLPGGQYQAAGLDTAVPMAERLLSELTASYSVKASVSLMPEKIFVHNQWNQPSALEDEQVTDTALQELFEKFFAGKLKRLELFWISGSLVFIEQGKQYACMYFNHSKSDWYGLVSMPEVYAVVESKDVIHVPFGLGLLPNYLVHQNLNYIKKNLNRILDQIACVNPHPESMFWSPQIYRFETKLKYHLAKRLYGGYTAEQARNQLMDRFCIPVLPESIDYTELDGSSSGTVSIGRDKAAVQNILSRYLSGKLKKLTLTWQQKITDDPDAEPLLLRRHIVLVQDQGRHQMFYLNEQRQEMEYLVSDVNEYLKAEGKKYRKTSFLGKTVPGYLVHEDLLRIRDYLDLLIPQIQYPDAILRQFGEFAFEKAVPQ